MPAVDIQIRPFRHSPRKRSKPSAELSYFRTDRNDEFAGYNDYTLDKFRLTSRIKFTDRLRMNLRFTTRDQDHDNAFAFDDPTQAMNTYDGFEAYANTEYWLRDPMALYAEVRYQDIDSSDPRGKYERTRAAIGVSWEY